MNNIIVVNPNIHFGKPCITGTRITVQNILKLIREGISFEEILQDYYPDLKIEDLQACLEYAIHITSVVRDVTQNTRELSKFYCLA